ncbi:MAG: PTS sugar transporter subunit IIA [Verrucomicrobiota bacterium]|nr:PTS sugar transporter subunit IIA [Verrucomicrobiota bacterium]MDQ6940533.1 PTS sugar transporter subunit IIA [Verrucomicrobiota bacterium]
MATVLADLLNENQVVLDLRATARDEALREIVATMTGTKKVRDEEKFIAEVRAREDMHTTYMGNGIAFPHTRTDLVERIMLGIGRSRAGVQFGDNSEIARLIFLIGVPQRMVTDYLVCVGALSRLASDAKMRDALLNAVTPAEVVTLLSEGSLVLE